MSDDVELARSEGFLSGLVVGAIGTLLTLALLAGLRWLVGV